MPDSYYSGAGYPYPVEERCPGGKYYVPENPGYAGSIAGSAASSATIRPTYVNAQNQLGIDYPASQISRASGTSAASAARSNAGSYHSLRDVDPSDSVSVVGGGGSVVSTASRASRASRASNLSHVSRASSVRPEDSLSQVGGNRPSPANNRGRAQDLSPRELALLRAQGGHHAPTIVSMDFSRPPSVVGSQVGSGSQAGGGQIVPYGAAGSDISTDSTLVIDVRGDEIARQGGNNNSGGSGGGDLNIVVTEADVARGRDMWPGLDRASIVLRMKVVLTREEVTRRMAARSRR
ncbi:hypothetical protein B0T20DRAFT_243950 [Sordaria brevicollis]|uniref:Uncharacterized protein n=1 Tax=Sordaria brevicollis TaxID=83679 RepID=A0AAE0UAC0_SORBR|nr:hypothetical protein B0T20DRAFT_243950 [Sordaria brevicollis]